MSLTPWRSIESRLSGSASRLVLAGAFQGFEIGAVALDVGEGFPEWHPRHDSCSAVD